MAWNAGEVEAALLASPAFALALAGHDHVGGYAARGSPGRHFLTLEALLEAPPGSNAYALLAVGAGRVDVRGAGSASSRELLL
jgi:manganese-dependent ADP-ribose/CDP-alcohol diphosphatase